MLQWLASLLVITISVSAVADTVTTYISPRALVYIPVVRTEIDTYLPQILMPYYVPALIEHESCVSLTGTRCWNPTVEFKTSRERGAGLGQVTVAYRKDGRIRFDMLQELKDANPSALADISWQNISTRPDLQIRAVVLLVKRNYTALHGVPDEYQRLAMVDAAYNGGISGVRRDRTACGVLAGCDPNIWFGHTERTCMKSKRRLYGTRSACDINRYHVHSVMIDRMPKYKLIY